MENTEIRKRINRACLTIFVFLGVISALQFGQMFISEIFYAVLGDESAVGETVDGILSAAVYIIGYMVSLLIFKLTYSKDYMPIRTAMSLGSHPIPMIFSALSICITVSYFVGYFTSGDPVLTETYHDQGIVILMLTTVLVPAFCEELFFRGVIMTNLMPLGRNFAIIASGVIFGLVHGNHDQIFFATIAGIIFGWLYAETGTIWCGVLTHMLNNFISVIESVLYGTLTEATATKLCILIEAFVLICGVVSIIYLVPRLKNEKQEKYRHGCFGKDTDKLLDTGKRFTVSEYLRGFFSPAMIAILCYVALNEVVYVYLS